MSDYQPPGSKYLVREEAARNKAAVAGVYEALLRRAPENRVEPRLDAVRRVLELLGDPHRAYPVIHVTGTNGKTSTSRMIDALLSAHELRVGRFTSPHLSSVTERISIDGQPISAGDFIRTYEEVEPLLLLVDNELGDRGEPLITYFEALTVLAFAAFADAPVEVAVLEVGMGGLWDSTNVADGQVAVISPVSLDHQQYLGDTIGEIATEKAGIIKDFSSSEVLGEAPWVVLAAQEPEADDIFAARIEEVGARGLKSGVNFGLTSREVAVGGQQISLQGVSRSYQDIFLPLHGAHQADNAALALAAVEVFLTGAERELDPEVVQQGFAAVTSPGRLEIVRTSPTVLLDAAHNAAGAVALAEALQEAFSFARVIGVIGVLADKDAEALLEALEPVLELIIVSKSSSPRSYDPEELGALAADIFGEDRVIVVPKLDDALVRAVEEVDIGMDHGSGVVVTGSVTTVADARSLLGRDGEG
ncbi:folylpolyglutamate synthase/dihydrofolate synthase family protein [Saxibacter everestensis]|uniref:tetrahydrofolate synthase n=1 Tax=Saxibacter everestensis TaxID=2909229 RepID=A0ABY8QYD0_9MICO|nr:folylpolyglutamate synthase/dihydrofolate synthase family protein [Brevibacteriaceae bacterium ZFBP1038]